MDEDANFDNLIDSNQLNDNQLDKNEFDDDKFNSKLNESNGSDLFLNENSNYNESNDISIDNDESNLNNDESNLNNDESNLNNEKSILETSDMDEDNLSNLNENTTTNESKLKDDNQLNISNNLIEKLDKTNEQTEIDQNNDKIIDQNNTNKIDKKSSNKSHKLIVHLLNGGKFECSITSKSIGKEVFSKTCDYLILREHEYFGLTYRDTENIRIWINLDKKIFKQIKDNPNSLHFEVKFFPEPADLKENITRFFICLQIRNNIIEEKIICSNDNYALLGSYLVQSEFGNYDPDKHKDDYLNEFKFAPKPTPELIKQLHELHKERKGLTAPEAELQFLQNAKRLSIYGLDFYPATDLTNNELIKIGVCSSGLSVYKDSKCLESYPWLKINKISYNVDNFNIRVKPNGDEEDKQQDTPQDNIVNFKLCSAKAAYDLWKITVEHHTFFKSLSSSTLKSNNKSSSKKNSKDKSSKSKHHHHHHHHHKSSSKSEKDSKSKIRSSKKDKSKKENIKTSSRSKTKLNDNNLKLTKLEKLNRHDKTDKLNNSNKHHSRKELNDKDNYQKEDKDDHQSREYLKDRNHNNSEIQLKNKKEDHSNSRHKRKRDDERNNYSIKVDKSIRKDSRERKLKLNLEDKLNHQDDKISNRKDEYRELKRRDEYDYEQREKERERNHRNERDHHRVERTPYRSPNRRSPNRRSPNHKSPNRRSPNRRSPNRRSPNQRSLIRRSPNRRSPNRRSPNRRSLNRRSPNRRSPNRRSPNQRSLIRRSPNRRSPNRRSLNRRSPNRRSTNRDKSNSRDKHKRHKHKSKHSRHDNERISDKKINLQSTTLSIAESHYQNLEMESINYLDEKQKSKEERSKHKKSRKSSVENKSPLNDDQQSKITSQQQKSNKNESISKKISDHFQTEMDLDDDKSNDNSINNNKQNDSNEQIVTQSKPGPPSKKDVKLNSKSNVEFDIFWDNEKSNEESQNKSLSKDDNQISNKDKDKNFIPRVLLNGNESNKPTTTFKFEIKSNRSTNKYSGPKTPPDDFNIFETNTLSNQSIPTPTQDESQLCLNSNDKFNNSIVDSLNDNSVRSLSPAHSMQSEKSQLNDNQIKNNNLTSLNNQNSLNNHKNTNNKLHNNSTTSKYEIYDPEAPLESPDQQQKSNPFNSKNNYNLFNSCNKQINGDNFADMEIDSPISPSKPISPKPLNQLQQPKASTSNLSSLINQQQTQNPAPALKSADLKLVLDHLIKAAQLQQKKNGQQQQQQQSTNNLINSPFKKQQTNRHLNNKPANNMMNTDLEDDDMPSSATELNLREKVRVKYIKKLNRQERVVDELKCHLKPYYQRKEITKDEYKNIMRKAVPKICHSKTGEINPAKIKQLVENYIKKEKHARKAK